MKARKNVARITQADLGTIEALRREKANLASTLREVEAGLAQAEKSVIDRLNDGATIQAGPLRPSVEEKSVCNPSYKDELTAHYAQAHGIASEVVEAQVRARWTKVKEVLNISHIPPIKSIH